jgi:hypothetical protein
MLMSIHRADLVYFWVVAGVAEVDVYSKWLIKLHRFYIDVVRKAVSCLEAVNHSVTLDGEDSQTLHERDGFKTLYI